MKNFNWTTGTFVIGYHVGLLVGLPIYFYYRQPSLALVLTSVVLLFLTEIGIGAAFHRYYAHRCYTLSKPAEGVLLFLATLATQGSALRWSYEHRLHHSYVDTNDDPYSIRKGFWYAHMLWLFGRSRPIDKKWVTDLLDNRLVMFQHRFAGTLAIVSNFALFLAVGWLLGDYLGAFVLAWWTRLLVSHHLTWFVNSLAHCWGEQTYSKEHSAVDNYILAFLTVGEGYHNYHHTFPSDYRNGVRWYHFDPTKWTVWCLSQIGLAGNLKRFSQYRIKRRLLMADRKLLLDTLKQTAHRRAVELEAKVEHLAQALQEKLRRVTALAEQVQKTKRVRVERGTLRAMRRELRELRASIRHDWEAWSHLCDLVLQPA